MELYLVYQIHALWAVNQIESKTFFAKAPGAANPVKVRLVVCASIPAHGQVEVHHDGHLFHINTWGSRHFSRSLPHGHCKRLLRKSNSLPLEQTLVVISTFSLPSLKRSMTAALCSTVSSPLSKATW